MRLLSVSSSLLSGALLLSGSSQAATQLSVTSPLTQQYRVANGQVIQGSVVITNHSTTAATARLFLKDYTFNTQGSALLDPGRNARSNTDWIKLGSQNVTVAPKQSLKVPFTITVPARLNLPGTYWGVIVVEADNQTAAQAPKSAPGQQLGIQYKFQYGTVVITNLGDSGKRSLKFETPQFARNDQGIYQLSVALNNNGERVMRPRVTAEIYDQAGKLAARLPGQDGTLYPGTSVQQHFRLPALSAGSYQMVLLADNGDRNVFGIRYGFKIEK